MEKIIRRDFNELGFKPLSGQQCRWGGPHIMFYRKYKSKGIRVTISGFASDINFVEDKGTFMLLESDRKSFTCYIKDSEDLKQQIKELQEL